MSDRFGQLFGWRSQAVGEAPRRRRMDNRIDLSRRCSIRAGASTYAVAPAGQAGGRQRPALSGDDHPHRARLHAKRRSDHRANRIQGRVISGPAGSPATVEVPIRVAVVQGGVQERTITTKVYRTTVSMSAAGNDPFSLVAEDIVYPVPTAATVDTYIFYIGFDPQALTPEPKASRRKKK